MPFRCEAGKAYFMQIVTTSQMRDLEQNSAAFGVDSLRLMENAGSAAAKYISSYTNGVSGKKVVILCGKGNNGGDACVVARKLFSDNALVVLIMVSAIPSTKESFKMYERVKEMNLIILQSEFDMSKIIKKIENADILIDGVFGTGFNLDNKIIGRSDEIFEAYNKAKPILGKFSLDIPSGINADTGESADNALSADFTISFGAYKVCHFISLSEKMCGKVILADIAIPQEAYDKTKAYAKITEKPDIERWLFPREKRSNKGDYGKALIIAGSSQMSGAAVLSTKAALRCGTGLVTLATPKSVADSVAPCLIENLFLPLNETINGCISADIENLKNILEKADNSTAVLIGCGMGRNRETRDIVFHLIENTKTPLIIDADGINVISENIDILKTSKAQIILTPHPGEMARLIKKDVSFVQKNRIMVAEEFSKEFNCTVILKGYNSIIAAAKSEKQVKKFDKKNFSVSISDFDDFNDPSVPSVPFVPSVPSYLSDMSDPGEANNQRSFSSLNKSDFSSIYINTTGNPGLAKGGSGDVLAGIITSFVARGYSMAISTIMGAYFHGLSADICKNVLGETFMLGSDVIDNLSVAFRRFGV